MRLSILVLILTSAAVAAQGPKAEKSDELYFPVQVGAKRVMDAKLGSNQPGWTETVTKVDGKDGRFTVTVERVEGKRTSETIYEVSKEGLYRKTTKGKAEAEPVLLLKLPYKEGTTWTADGAGGLPTKVTYTVGKVEEVQVPAGKYKAIRLEAETKAGELTRKHTQWFAPGIGVIKTETPAGTIELKEFTPGKAAKT